MLTASIWHKVGELVKRLIQRFNKKQNIINED